VPLGDVRQHEGLVDVVAICSKSSQQRDGRDHGAQVPGGRADRGRALELSNVDLSNEFIGLIQASTGYSASSRVIQTCNDLFQQLLVLGR